MRVVRSHTRVVNEWHTEGLRHVWNCALLWDGLPGGRLAGAQGRMQEAPAGCTTLSLVSSFGIRFVAGVELGGIGARDRLVLCC
jgi:hypothetical protein